MTRERNREMATDFLRNHSYEDLNDDVITEDWRFWNPQVGYMDRSAWKDMLLEVEKVMPEPVSYTVIGTTAENDRVAVEVKGHGRLINGSVYENNYIFMFLFKDGKIREIREYLDTKMGDEIFGEVMDTASRQN